MAWNLGLLGASSAGLPPFPFDLADVDAWYDPADESSLTLSGSNISQINDKSGNGLHLSQATSADQPTLGTLNGYSALQYNQVEKLVAASASDWIFLSNGTTTLIGSVIKFTTSTGTATVLIGTGGGSKNLAGTRLLVPGGDGNFEINVSNGSGNSSTAYSVNNVFSYSIGNADTMTFITDPDNGTIGDRSEAYVDESSAFKNNTKTNGVSASNTFPFVLGNNNPTADKGPIGFIGEVVVMSGANATEANRIILRDYLIDKWGTV